MVKLPKEAVRKLAVLYALSQWNKGAYGPMCVHKTLFFAEKDLAGKYLFTFKKYRLGQYSKEIDDALNSLQEAKRLHVVFDGAATRLATDISWEVKNRIALFFVRCMPEWQCSLQAAIKQYVYMKDDDLIRLAHEDGSYTEKEIEHEETIHESQIADTIELPEMDNDIGERLIDLVDNRLACELIARLDLARKTPQRGSDWRSLFESETA